MADDSKTDDTTSAVDPNHPAVVTAVNQAKTGDLSGLQGVASAIGNFVAGRLQQGQDQWNAANTFGPNHTLTAPQVGALTNMGVQGAMTTVGSVEGAPAEDLLNQETNAVRAPADAAPDLLNQESMPVQGAQSVADKIAFIRAAKAAAKKNGAAMADGGEVSQDTDQPAASTDVNVVDPDGNLVSLPHEQVSDAIQNGGYQPATKAHIDSYVRNQAYGGAGQGALSALEGAASAATFGGSTALERGFTAPEDIAGRAEEHPIAHGAGELGGLLASSMVPGGAGSVLEHAGQMASDAAGLGTLSVGAKVGSAAVKAATENALFQGGDEVSRYFSDQSDPNTPVQTAVVDMLGAGLIGGSLGAAGSSVSSLWKATVGDKLGGTLGAIAGRLGGQDGIVPGDVGSALKTLGIDAPPEVAAAMSSDPAIKQMASALAQTDTNASGLKYQEALKGFRSSIIDSISRTMGVEPEALTGEFSNAEAGTHIGKALADEYGEKMSPISDMFESNKAKYGGAELSPSIADRAPELQSSQDKLMTQLNKANQQLQKSLKSQDVDAALGHTAKIGEIQSQISQLQNAAKIPGTVDDLATKLWGAVTDGGWADNDDIMKQVNKVMAKLPEMKTVGDIQKEMSRVGEVGRDLQVKTFGQQTTESRAMGGIKAVLRSAEENSVGSAIGSEEGEEALAKFNQARKDFAGVAGLKDDLDARLGAKGSATNYAKSIAAMVKEDPEKIYRKLSGKGDSALLDTLTKHFPETAQALREAHMQDMLSKAVRSARNEDKLNPTTLRKSLSDMAGKSPELKNFILDPTTRGKLDASAHLLEKMNDPHFNFSNTARTHAKLTEGLPGSAMGLISMLTGHGLGASFAVGHLTKYLGKDIPDAARLSLLKFLGSNKPIEPGAFKSMVDFVKSTVKGENAVNGAVSSLFKAGREVIPSRLIADQRDNDKLEKHLESSQENPSAMLNQSDTSGGLGHYMPNHASAQAQTATNVTTYLNSIKPKSVQMSPLDTKYPLTREQKTSWQNALTIANQPLTVIRMMKDGTMTSKDVMHLNAMYPQLAQSLRNKIIEEITSQKSEDANIPYRQRIMMSMFLGKPLDSTMQPASILAAQPQPQQQPAPPPEGRNKKNTASLGKNNSLYKTPSQAAEQDRQRDT